MKKIYFFLLGLLLLHQSSEAQWSISGSAFVGIARGLFFLNEDTGYAVGAGGVISKTTDGGVTWTPQVSGVITDLRSVKFLSNTLGYISGAAGVILKTTDGGATWTPSNAGINTAYTLRAIDFTSLNTGFAAATGGHIYKTTDAGATWTDYALSQTSDVIQLDMIDSQTGYAVCAGVAFPFNPGYVFKTSDGGNSWTEVYSNLNFGFLGLAAANDLTVYAGGDTTIIRTTDGGTTWDTVFTAQFNVIRGGFALSEMEAYLVSDNGHIVNTADGGTTWSDTLVSLSGFYSVYFINQVGYAGDGAGNIYKLVCVPPSPAVTFSNGILTSSEAIGNQWYVDGALISGATSSTYTPTTNGTYYTVVTNPGGCTGTSNSISVIAAQWTALTSGVTNTLRSVYFIDDSIGWVCGESDGTNAPILKTTNSGATWTLTNYPTANALRAIQFLDDNTGIITGFGGTILRTTDGGNSWVSVPSGTTVNLRSVSFPSHDIGYACGTGTILKTTNAGLTWTSQISGPTGDWINIRFSSNDTGYAVQSGSNLAFFPNGFVIKTTDGGATWDTVYSNPDVGLLALAAVDENTAYVGGRAGTIFKTGDGGANWNQVYTDGDTVQALRGSYFLNDNIGWMVGQTTNSYILYTNDGGGSWTNQSPVIGTFVEFLGIHAPSSNVGFTVGTIGTILRYTASCTSPDAAAAIFGPTSVCSETTAQYSIGAVNGATFYTWSVPVDAVINSGQGTTAISVTFGVLGGQISVTSENVTCGTGGSISINIVVNPSPSPTITFINNILTSSDLTGNQWYYNGSPIGGATNPTYTPILNGSYYTIVTNSFGCTGTSNSIDVIGLGISNLSGSSLTIFPNPSADVCTIHFPKMADGKLKIVNTAGVIEFSEINLSGDEFKLNTASLAGGFYFIQLYNHEDHLIATAKLIVQ